MLAKLVDAIALEAIGHKLYRFESVTSHQIQPLCFGISYVETKPSFLTF